MPRRPRVFVPGHPVHVIQRGHNRSRVFFAPADGRAYLEWLQEAAEKHGLAIHAYVLMINHVHLLATPQNSQSLPRAMRDANRRYGRHINETTNRTGSLWEGRYRASVVDADSYVLACSRYIEMNPVRAGASQTPGAYRWSSYRFNAEAKPDVLLTPHPAYLALGATPDLRADAYRGLFDQELAADAVEKIRTAIRGDWALGDAHFTDLVSRHAGASMAPRGRGRPPLESGGRGRPPLERGGEKGGGK
jgi:putative transposase